MERNTRKYKLVDKNGKSLYYGITNDLERREAEHRNDGKKFDQNGSGWTSHNT